MMSALISFLPIQLDWHRAELPSSPPAPPSSLSPPSLLLLQSATPSINLCPLDANSSEVHCNSTTCSNTAHLTSTAYKFMNFSTLPLTTPFHNATCHDHQNVCQLDLSPMYAVVSSTISFYLPCLAMTFIYYRLLQYAKKHVSHIKMTTTSHAFKPPQNAANAKKSTTKHNSYTNAHNQPANTVSVATSSQYKTSDHKASVTLGIIMGTFLLCWAPFFTVNVVDSFCR